MGDRIRDRPKGKSAGGRWRRWVGRGFWCLTIGGLLIAAAYFNRTSLLTDAAKVWVVNDPVAKADAIVVLGGGVDTRPFTAAKLYRAGVAPLILYMNVRLSPAEKLGIVLPEGEETRRILLSSSVPAGAMLAIGTNVASTYDESLAVRSWGLSRSAKSIVIVTDVFHTRRARWVFEKQLRGTGLQVFIQGATTLDYGTTNWWQHEQGVIDFQNEVIKYFYYRLVH
ncbi:MAG: YdcF family protein [Verrucomicrobiota bacterium]